MRMATKAGEVIYEDYLYKLRKPSGFKTFSFAQQPWKLKYFILKKYGEVLVLEYFDKKPKNKNASPKGKLNLCPVYRVEKITNAKNRAYVFKITTPESHLCLSADEQRILDMFAFFLQVQIKLIDEVRDDYFSVQPENSETLRRIGAKGCLCQIHVSPWGLTLFLQASRRLLAQWPLKSIRSYESSGKGNFSLEAGRIAPMGDGLYMFHTQAGDDNKTYDLLDQYVIDALQKIRPGQNNQDAQIEDYVVDAQRLQALTKVSTCASHQEELPKILKENWNYVVQIPTQGNREVTPSIAVPSQPESNLEHRSQMPPLPIRGPPPSQEISTPSTTLFSNATFISSGGIHTTARELSLFKNSPLQSQGLKTSANSSFSASVTESESYLGMSPPNKQDFSPTSLQWFTPPSVSYLEKNGQGTQKTSEYNQQYLTCSVDELDPAQKPPQSDTYLNGFVSKKSRLKSLSCEDLNSYLKMTMLGQHTTAINVESDRQEPDKETVPVPFPRLQDIRCSTNWDTRERIGSVCYHNITKKSRGVYEPVNPGVAELRRLFCNDDDNNMRKSVSNPNFFYMSSRENFPSQKIFTGMLLTHDSMQKQKQSHRSLMSLLADTFRRKSTHDLHQTDREQLKSGRLNSFSRRCSFHGPVRTHSSENLQASVRNVRTTSKTKSYRKRRDDIIAMKKSEQTESVA